jgi:hypothetical protein
MGGGIQGEQLAVSGNAAVLAGAASNRDGVGSDAGLGGLSCMATDGTNLFVASDSGTTIRKIELATGAVTTLAGSPYHNTSADGIGSAAGFSGINSLAANGGNLYVADGATIRNVVIATGSVTTIAGTPNNFGQADGVGATASFSSCRALVTDGASLFMIDYPVIRKVDLATKTVTTLAGNADAGGYGRSVDGIGNQAVFASPGAMTSDGTNLYIVDFTSIRKMEIATREVSTLFPEFGFVGPGASFDPTPSGITTDGTNLYLAIGTTVRSVEIATESTVFLAGSQGLQGSKDGVGSAATFTSPGGIIYLNNSLYIADYRKVRKLSLASSTVTTVAGNTGSVDGPADAAKFSSPTGIATDGTYLYLADYRTIRRLSIASGTVITMAGNSEVSAVVDGVGLAARFQRIAGITTDGANLYLTDGQLIRRMNLATGLVSTVAGSNEASAPVDGTGTTARFNQPAGITTDGNNLFVVDNGNLIRKVVIATGKVTTLAGHVDSTESVDGVGASAGFMFITGITTDGRNLYVFDGFAIRKITLSTGAVDLLAGRPRQGGVELDGVGAGAMFASYGGGITTDGTYLYVANGNIRRVAIATGAVTTMPGIPGVNWSPSGITTDGKGLFVADPYNAMIYSVL